MNHEEIAALWVAFNTGAEKLVVSRSHRGHSQDTSHTLRVKPEARGAKLSYRRDTIYSYHYWPFGQFVRNENGTCVLWRDEKYSVSTGRHKYHAWKALGRVGFGSDARVRPVFTIEGEPSLDHKANIAWYMAQIREKFDGALRANKYAAEKLQAAHEQYLELERYAAFFNHTVEPWVNPFASREQMERFEAKLTRLSIQSGIAITKFWRQA